MSEKRLLAKWEPIDRCLGVSKAPPPDGCYGLFIDGKETAGVHVVSERPLRYKGYKIVGVKSYPINKDVFLDSLIEAMAWTIKHLNDPVLP